MSDLTHTSRPPSLATVVLSTGALVDVDIADITACLGTAPYELVRIGLASDTLCDATPRLGDALEEFAILQALRREPTPKPVHRGGRTVLFPRRHWSRVWRGRANHRAAARDARRARRTRYIADIRRAP